MEQNSSYFWVECHNFDKVVLVQPHQEVHVYADTIVQKNMEKSNWSVTHQVLNPRAISSVF